MGRTRKSRRHGLVGALGIVAFAAACGTGGPGGLDSNPFLTGEDPPPEGSEQAAGVSSEDETPPTSGEDPTSCPPCPVKCLFGTTTVTVTTTTRDADGGEQQNQSTQTVSESSTFKTKLADGTCGEVSKEGEVELGLTCGGRVVSGLIPGGVIGTWTDLGAGSIQVCLQVKSVLDDPLCAVCQAAEGSQTVDVPGGGGGGGDASVRDSGGTTTFDASGFDAAGFDAGFSFDSSFGTD